MLTPIQVCLHFAIVHNDLALVKLLVESGADCRTPHAAGDFFYEHRALYFGGRAANPNPRALLRR